MISYLIWQSWMQYSILYSTQNCVWMSPVCSLWSNTRKGSMSFLIEWSDTVSASWTFTWTPISKHPHLKANGTLLSTTSIFRTRRVQPRRPRKISRSTTHSNIAFTGRRWSQRRRLVLLTTMDIPKCQYMDWVQLYLEVEERIYRVSQPCWLCQRQW